jgi:sugar phosphate permease
MTIANFFMHLSVYGMMTWIPSYLVNERHFSMIRMGLLAAVPFCGSFIGYIGGGWASDRLWRGRRKPMMFLTAIAAVIMLFLLANAPASQTVLAVLLFLNGFAMCCSMATYISYPMGLTTPKTYPTALGMVATAAALGGFFSPMFAGYLLDVFKTFNVVFYFFALAFVVHFVFITTMVEPLQTIGAQKQ